MKRFIITFLTATIFIGQLLAQNVVITQFPQNIHFYARDVATNKATFTVAGYVKNTFVADTFRLELFRENTSIYQSVQPVKFTDGQFNFSQKLEIKAELANYQVVLTLFDAGKVAYTKKAERIVTGDVIVVNGQSNNIGFHEPVDDDPFIRSFTYEYGGWNDVRYSFAGKWPGRLVKNIVDKQKIPVALFNQSLGGERAGFYLKGNQDSSNYMTLFNRLKSAGVEKNVRAICWWQGESDGWETPLDTFKNQFKQMYNDWQKDYFNAPVFYFQIRYNSCRHVVPGIMETQRKVKVELPNAEIMSVNAALQYDSCHFFYNNGYDSLGNRLYRLVASRLYGGSSVNVRPSDVDRIWFSGTTELSIRMKNQTGDLNLIGSPWNDFEINLENNKVLPVKSGKVEGDKIILSFVGDSEQIKNIIGVSYKSHVTKNEDWIVNQLGVGILSFYNVPISSSPPSNTFEAQIEKTQWTLYPTVVDSKLRYTVVNKKDIQGEIMLVSLTGSIVLRKKLSATDGEERGDIDVSDLPKGMYIARYTEGGAIFKFFKM
jgi:hypothetical protein